MRCWIPLGVDGVHGGQHDGSVQDQEGAERMVARQSCLASEFDSLPHKLFVSGVSSYVRVNVHRFDYSLRALTARMTCLPGSSQAVPVICAPFTDRHQTLARRGDEKSARQQRSASE